MDEQYESIKNKLKKLLALAEQGVQGEADNARRLLEKLCKEYSVSIEELLDENQLKRYCFDISRNAIYKDLFVQCYCKVSQKISLSFYQESRSQISVEMTALQYAELVSLFEWHKANFNKDLEDMKKNILLAYCRKHHLYSDVKPDNDNDRELTEDERKQLIKIMFMQESLNDNQYHKLLEQVGRK